ncbi:MAG: hypothetical protein KBC81_00825 [Candidatus Pacebacteria bacterium]|nr:hypothetical protein [Candidatus Paceibacterota bacterium]
MNKTWTIILAIVVVAIAVWFVEGDKSGVSLNPGTTTSPTMMATKTPATSVNPRATTTPVATVMPSYSQLVAQYGANRIQFTNDCQAIPASMVFKSGGSLLLDNRMNKAITVTISGMAYPLGAYGYKVVTVSSPSAPKIVNVACDARVNASSINLQANISGE